MLKLNTDTSVYNNHRTRLDIVNWDEYGQVLMSTSKRLMANCDVNLAEVHAIMFGLELDLDGSFNCLMVEGDSKCTMSTH